MSGVVKRVQHKYIVPPEVRQYMQGNVEEVTWSFIDPTDALVRMLVLSPLAGNYATSPSCIILLYMTLYA